MRLSTILPSMIVMVCAAPQEIPAYVERYLPLSKDELSHRFPQRLIRKDFLPLMGDAGERVRIGSTSVSFGESDEIQFTGTDLAGKQWTVAARGGMGGALYAADLDHNGQADIIYASYTGANGWAPPMHVLTLMFDKTGRPVVSEMDGYFEADARGLKDLLDLDHDSKAELVRQSFDDGYWITSLYVAQEAHWHIVKGLHADRHYPLYTRFTNRANRVPVTPPAGRHPMEDDLSNGLNATGPAVRLERFEWADVRQSGNPTLHFSNGRNCVEIGWYSTAAVVVDTPEHRVEATLGAPDATKQLLDEIVRNRIPVHIAGHRRDPARPKDAGAGWCTVEMIWAASPVNLP